MLDHFHGLVVVLDGYMPPVDVCVELLHAVANQQPLLFFICVTGFDISQ